MILLAGLQGAGKTTTAGKLAKLIAEQYKKKVLTVSCDVYRPAAIQQLETVAAQAGADFFPSQADQKPVDIALAAVAWAKTHFHDVLIVDTAGRLGIDAAMMQEIAALHAAVHPVETLFVVDAMLGQDAVNTAKAFHDALPLTGVILTKLDGDARGGAALSVRQITGAPIKFAGVGEKLTGFEVFHPERMAEPDPGHGRHPVPGRGGARQHRHRCRQQGGRQAQIGQGLRPGRLQGADRADAQDGRPVQFVDKLPAQFAQAAQGADMGKAERDVKRMEGIINSMTPLERSKPELIKAKRKQRIAAGAGVHVQEVNRMLKQFEQMQAMMKQMQKGGLQKMMRGMGKLMPGGFPGMR